MLTPGRAALAAIIACILAAAHPLRAEDRCVIADFEDVSTWRCIGSVGTPDTSWFAGDLYLGSTQAATRHDDYVGEIHYACAPGKGPWRMTFQRERVARVSADLTAIECDINANGFTGSVQYDLADATGTIFRTAPMEISGNNWTTYRFPVDAKHVPGLAKIKFPVHVQHLVLNSNGPGQGSVYIDDLTLIGKVSSDYQCTIAPLPDPLLTPPDAPVRLGYRIRNARDTGGPATVQLKVIDDNKRVLTETQQTITLPPTGQTQAHFELAALPRGAYSIQVDLQQGESTQHYDDWLLIGIDNNKPLNHTGMALGVQDQTSWQCPGENKLHMQWMRQLGVDLTRVGVAGGWLEPREGTLSIQPLLNWISDFDALGIGVCFLYTDSVPGWTQTTKRWKYPPDDIAAFERHAEHLGAALSKQKNLRYLEFWNEPDLDFFAGDQSDYLRMQTAFYRGFKRTAPQIPVTSGSVTVNHPRTKKNFAADMFAKGESYYDVAAFHSHGPLQNYQRAQAGVESWLAKVGNHKPLINTESGERSGYSVEGAWRQADTLIKKITYARSVGTDAFIWFILQDYWDMDPKADDSLGLVTCDNRGKPSYLAYNELIRQLASTQPAPADTLHPDLVSYRFRDESTGDFVYVCWPKRSGEAVFVPVRSDQPLLYTDSYGQQFTATPQDGIACFAVNRRPLFVRTRAATLASVPLTFITLPKTRYTVPGEKADLPITLLNTVKSNIHYNLTWKNAAGQTVAHRQGTLAPRQNWSESLAGQWKPRRLDDSENQSVELKLTGGTQQTLTIPVLLRAAYAVTAADTITPEVWRRAGNIRLASAEDIQELAFDPTIHRWTGPSDLSVSTALLHTPTDLLVRVDVTDDHHVQEQPDGDIWMGDSLQFALLAPDGTNTEFTAALTSAGPVVWREGTQRHPWNIPAEITRTGTHTLYVLHLPLKEIGLAGKPVGSSFRFAFLVNENDGQGRVRFMRWFDGIGTSKNSDAYGYGVLK